jgi:hypothetical protein
MDEDTTDRESMNEATDHVFYELEHEKDKAMEDRCIRITEHRSDL